MTMTQKNKEDICGVFVDMIRDYKFEDEPENCCDIDDFDNIIAEVRLLVSQLRKHMLISCFKSAEEAENEVLEFSIIPFTTNGPGVLS